LRAVTVDRTGIAARVVGSARGWTVLTGAVLALVTLAFERYYLPLPYPSDQLNYLDAARDFPNPDPGTPVHQFTRYGLTLPIRAGIEAFGYSQAAYYGVPVLTGLALVLAVYLLGTQLFARSVGVAAAALTLTNNLVFLDALHPLPDVLATALFCWAMVVTVAIRQERPLVWATRRRRVLALVLLGVLLGWSYLAREFIVFAWPLVPILLARRVGWRGLGLVALPLVATGVLEFGLNALAYGDPFARLRAVTGHGSGPVPEELAVTFQDMPRRWYLLRFTHGLSVVPERDFLVAALVATVVGGVLAWRRLGLLLGWLALVYVPLVLLGGVLDPSAPKLRLFIMRYWFPVFPAFLLGGFAAVWLLVRLVASRTTLLRAWAGLLASVVTLSLGAGALVAAEPSWGFNHNYHVVRTKPPSNFRDWLVAHPDARTIWSDGRGIRVLRLYANDSFGTPVWSGRFAALSKDGPRPARGDYVVLYGTRGPVPCYQCGDAARAVLGDPIRIPPSWRQVFDANDGALLVYRVE
jgi:hypothetical protein